MPPTMMVTAGAFLAADAVDPVDAVEALLAQPVIAVVDTTAPTMRLVRVTRRLRCTELSYRWVGTAGGTAVGGAVRGAGGDGSVEELLAAHLGWPPAQEPVLEHGDERLGHQRDEGDQHHAGEDAVHVEVVLRAADQQAEALVRAEQLPD